MIVYFSDKKLEIKGLASTSLPEGLKILSDAKVSDIDSGATTFECTFAYENRVLAEEMTSPGNYILVHADEDEVFQIVTCEIDAQARQIRVYAEDAGLDLLNTVVNQYAADANHSLEWYANKWLKGGWSIGINEAEGTKKLKWDGESTLTERLISIANSFSCELSYSFDIENMEVTARHINFHKNRGNGVAEVQLQMGRDVTRITINKSNENLATALAVTGDGINLKDYTYNYTDSNGDVFKVDKTTGQMRCTTAMERVADELDTDGLIVRRYQYSTKDKATLAGKARAELQKMIYTEVTYDCEFLSVKGAKIGDRVNMVDDEGELYLDARILNMTTSEIDGTVQATLGEFVRKTAGISERLQELADRVSEANAKTVVIKIASSNGITFNDSAVNTNLVVICNYGEQMITDITTLREVLGDVSLKWYENDTAIASTDPRLSAEGFVLNINTAMTDKTAFRCELVREL